MTRRAGLTLMEVMLALVILGAGLSVLIVTTSRCLGVARQARNFETARHLLQRVEVEQPLAARETLEPGVEEGDFADVPGWRWARAIDFAGDPEDGLFSVTLRVSWSDRGRDAAEELTSYLYAPQFAKKGSF